jgi:hypothetical protein
VDRFGVDAPVIFLKKLFKKAIDGSTKAYLSVYIKMG